MSPAMIVPATLLQCYSMRVHACVRACVLLQALVELCGNESFFSAYHFLFNGYSCVC